MEIKDNEKSSSNCSHLSPSPLVFLFIAIPKLSKKHLEQPKILSLNQTDTTKSFFVTIENLNLTCNHWCMNQFLHEFVDVGSIVSLLQPSWMVNLHWRYRIRSWSTRPGRRILVKNYQTSVY